MLDRQPHEGIEELFECHLSRNRLRDLDHGCEIQVLEGSRDQARHLRTAGAVRRVHVWRFRTAQDEPKCRSAVLRKTAQSVAWIDDLLQYHPDIEVNARRGDLAFR